MRTLTLLVLLAAITLSPEQALSEDVGTPPPAHTREVVVYKSPWCGCCKGWADHMKANGFHVKTHEMEDLSAVKRMAGIPEALESCHTAFVGGYAVEGHVPSDVISRLLSERPDVKGVAVPGMPEGSPGMEGPDPEAYDVLTFTKDGSSEVFSRVQPQ